MSEEKRIYVVVADTVQVKQSEAFTETIVQAPGRLAAQVGHVVSKMRVTRAIVLNELFTPITTIVLSARDSKELQHIRFVIDIVGIKAEAFYDENEDVYGWNGDELHKVLTAVATHPVDPVAVTGVLDHLPLWKPMEVAA